ncbi:hypothetical protein GDO86_010379 [Hymenochirus boettgeri]|uniref:F-box only protein 25 n=1 Tax=Hymenochirus boettgeri TaxID=247094 RepID=A0A8T2JK90_9PIPI|nr:hypothetical protein GDO86_010379 [Hymenochirus boettgeri]KAG8445580.1 hypothetical protein GDO86_010379 [Hymenochirus boettgeri]
MPFLGQDWRSPGWSWMKTDNGWERCKFYCDYERDDNCNLLMLSGANQETDFLAQKRNKELINSTTKSQNFYQEKWIFVQKESTKQIHGYSTLGEAFNRLDFSNAIQDIRRFNYVVRLLQLIAKSQLKSFSGAAQKNYFNILEKIVQKVLQDQYNPRLVRELLKDLSSSLCLLIREVGKSVLIGNINIWICRIDKILLWQHQLLNLQMPEHLSGDLTICDLPLHMQRNILYRFSDALDIISVGEVTPTMQKLSDDCYLWKNLCKYHFAEKMFSRQMIVSEKGHIDWKQMFFALEKYYPKREQYGDTLQFCRHCSILFWKDSGHPCTSNDPDSCLIPVSPQHFISLFRF